MTSFKKTLITVTIFMFSISYYEVIVKPFPFIGMSYSSTIEAVDEFSYKNSSNYKSQNIDLSATQNMSQYEKIIWAVEEARYLQNNSKGSLLRDQSDIFNDDIKYQNICSENSKILSSYLNELGFINRIIWMNGHTVTEVFFENKWVLLDSYGNVLAKDIAGNLLSLYEVLNDFNNANFYKITKNVYNNLPEYTENNYLQKSSNVYAQQDLYVVLNNESVANLHKRNRNFPSVVFSFLSNYEKGVGQGIQFVFDDRTRLVGNFGIDFYKKIIFFIKEL